MSPAKQAVLGIDLGTTYSVVACVDETGRPTIIRNLSGEETTPSVVHFESESSIVVGQTAKDTAVVLPGEVVSLVKRHMGNKDYAQSFHGKEHSAPAVSALILKALVSAAESDGYQASSVVITVPAYFGMLEKEATRQAGQLAGLDVAGIVAEPVAAALYYGLQQSPQDETVLVYDLGGGTFDVTVMRIGATAIEVLAVGGDHNLGGANWDEVLFEHVLDQVAEQAGDDSFRDDAEIQQDTWTRVERSKKELSTAESRTVIVRHGGGTAKVVVTRAQFEDLTRHLLEKTVEITRRTLDEAEALHPGVRQQIGKVLLVGGSSRMPAVETAIRAATGLDVQLNEPDLAVAKGAALYAAGMAAREIVMRHQPGETVADTAPVAVEDVSPEVERKVEARVGVPLEAALRLANRSVQNVLPKAVGVKLVDPDGPGRDTDPAFYIHHLVGAQTPLPFEPEKPFAAATVSPQQDVIRIEIWEQAGPVAGRAPAENTFLAFGDMTDLRSFALPAGSPVDISFNVDHEGLVRVSAVEPTSGKKVQVEAKIQLLSDAEMETARASLSGLTART